MEVTRTLKLTEITRESKNIYREIKNEQYITQPRYIVINRKLPKLARKSGLSRISKISTVENLETVQNLEPFEIFENV